MRVIYATGARFAGSGIGTTGYHTVHGLARHGMLQRVLCGSTAESDIPPERVWSLGAPSRLLRKLASLDMTHSLWYLESLLFEAWACARLERADLLHVWSNYGLGLIRQAKRLGMVTVLERGSTHPSYQDRLLRTEYARWGLHYRSPQAALRRIAAELQEADYVLVPATQVRKTFLGEGFPAERLLELPYGADVQRFRPAAGRAAHPFRVLFVGQVGVRKGVPALLDAWRALGWRDAELWLVGRVEPGFGRLLSRWQGLPGVRLLGHIPNPVEAYQQSDVFALPSLEEGSALVSYEALACGLPVITTPNTGSVVRDGEEGLLVPPRAVDALAAAIERLRSDEPLHRRMGRAARARAEAFTWEHYEDTLAALYQGLIGSRGGEPA